MLTVNPMFAFSVRKPIEFVSSSINRVTSTATNEVNAPASIVAGDLLVMVGSCVVSRSITSPPSGWTQNLNEADVPSAQVFTKLASGSEPASYTWGWNSSGNNTIAILNYRNAVGVDLVGSRTRGSNITVTGAGITTTREGVLIGVYSTDVIASVSTPPSGMTQRALQNAARPSLAAYDLIPSPVGASGNKNLVWSGAATNVGWLIQIY
jgi:hypothetical protein